MPRCLTLVPYLTHVEPACERSLRELESRGIEVRRYASTAAIDRTRSEAATAALRDGYDELMWIDSDIVFEADDVLRLRAHGLPMVAGIYAKKGARGLAVSFGPEVREIEMGERGGLHPARFIGAGFLFTHRRVYDDIERTFSLPTCNVRFGTACVPYFLPLVIADPDAEGHHWYLSEDYAFCERARRAGHALVVDTAIRLGHVGSYAYGWEDAGQAIPRVTGAKFTFEK